MKKLTLNFLILSIFLLGSITFSETAFAENEEGMALFEHRCSLCHRQGGTGTFMLDRRLGAAESLLEQRNNLTEAYVNTVVRWGVGSMPRFSRGEITDQELEKIVAYLTDEQ